MNTTALILLTWALNEFSSGQSWAESSCLTCHEKEALAEQGSPHHRAGITCVQCHGGDASKLDKEASKAEGTGFLGKLTKVQVVKSCGECHADVRKMNPYGLPTDQLAQYRASHHGEALFNDDNEDVASCADCHGAHGIVGADSPTSPVYPKTITETCGRCHSNPELMSEYDLMANQAANYKKSVHAELLSKGDLSAPTCVTCHGNHGAVPPGFSKVGAVCGKCHVRQKEFFDRSPHKIPADDDEFNTCVTCHGNHRVSHPSDGIYSRCQTCHDREDEDDKAYQLSDKIRQKLSATRDRFTHVNHLVDQATRAGLMTDDEQMLLQEAKTLLTQFGPTQHSLTLEPIEEIEAQTMSLLNDIKSRAEHKADAVKKRRQALIPIAVFLLLLSIGFNIKLKQLRP